MRNMFRTAFAALALTVAATAQCPNVTFSFYGQTCMFFNQPAPLGATYDNTSCTIRFQLPHSRTCCNTFTRLQVLFLGVSPIDPGLQHPALEPGCVLSVFPLVSLAQPVTAGGNFDVTVPPINATVYAQGLNVYFTTIGRSDEFQTSDAIQVDIR